MTEPCNFQLDVIEFLMGGTMANLSGQVSSVASSIGTYAAGFAAAGCALYGVLWTVAFVTGTQNGDVMSFIKWLARAMFFIALAGTGSLYNEYVTQTFWDAPAEVAQYVSKGMGDGKVQYDAEGRLNMGTALDAAASKGVCTATSLWEATAAWKPVESLGYFLAGLVVILGVVVFVALAAGLSFMGYASLSIVLALGPLFIVCGIWEATRPMFESFIRTALNYALYGVVLMVIVGIGIGMVDGFAKSTLGSVNDSTLADLGEILRLVVRTLFVFSIAGALLFKADDISASLVGGISMGAGGLLARSAATPATIAKAARSTAKAAANPGKTAGEALGGTFHTDPRTGKVVYKSAWNNAKSHVSALANARARNTIKKS